MNLSRPLPKNLIKPKIIAIVGPTASGKSALAVHLAKHFNGEVVSADSRQVYRGMDIGTGKITASEMRGVPHHMLDVASPKTIFDVARYQKMAYRVIKDILKRGKLPIICGGTGLYIKAIVENPKYPSPKPDWKLRKRLEQKTPAQLFAMLQKLDRARAKTIDRHNPRRLMRAIEISKALGKVPPLKTNTSTFLPIGRKVHICVIGVKKSPAELKRAIEKRLGVRMRKGMLLEVARLHRQGISWKRMEQLGLEYKYCALHLQKKMTREELIKKLTTKIWRYSRRQMTWFRKTKGVRWIRTPREAERLTKIFLKK